MIPACSLPHSQMPATCLCPEPDSSSPCLPILPLGDAFCCYPPVYAKIFEVVSFPQVSQPKDYTYVSCVPYLPNAPLIWFLIWSRKYLLRCTDHESYFKIYSKILPIVIMHVCVIIQVFLLWYSVNFFNLGDVFFKFFFCLVCNLCQHTHSSARKFFPL